MNREIKFRAWDIEAKKMLYFDVIAGHMPSNWCDFYILMQYTGLKDSKGTEIYEGDLLDVDTENRRVKVVWFEPQACFDTEVVMIIDKAWPVFLALQNSDWSHRCEVIGNIYKELLDEKTSDERCPELIVKRAGNEVAYFCRLSEKPLGIFRACLKEYGEDCDTYTEIIEEWRKDE